MAPEEIICFYIKFFTSEYCVSLFNVYLNKSIEAVTSLVKANSLEQILSVSDLVSVSLNVLSKCMINYFNYRHDLNRLKSFFEALDAFLLTFSNDDKKKFFDLKKELLLSVAGRKLHMSLTLKLLDQRMKDKRHEVNWTGVVTEPWLQMLDEFFKWLCSADEVMKDKLKEQAWESEEVLKAKKRFLK